MNPTSKTIDEYRRIVDAERAGASGDPTVAVAAAGKAAGEKAPPSSTPPGELPEYQQKGRRFLKGYLNNPLDAGGREEILFQFMQAPLGGHVRSRWGHRAEQAAAAGIVGTAIGAGALMSAAGGSSQQTPETIPLTSTPPA